MAKIELVGQIITSVDYATERLFNFSPEMVEKAAKQFLASGITKIEIPEEMLDPNRKFLGKQVDEETVKETVNRMPEETELIASYFGAGTLGTDNATYLNVKKMEIDSFLEFFPTLRYIMLHPPQTPALKKIDDASIQEVVKVWDNLAIYASKKSKDLQLCLHNHYDSTCETADQVRMYLKALRRINNPALRWGPDTAHCHGMKEKYLNVFEENADLIGDYFHIKARVPAFDVLHGGDEYRPDRDIWKRSKAEAGTGLYGGFVNVADPEIQTPFKEVFSIIRDKTDSDENIIYGAMEIDIPRQHPLLEIMCAVLYLKSVHGITPTVNYSYEEIVGNVFSEARDVS